MWLRLVPICDRIKIVGAVAAPAALILQDGHGNSRKLSAAASFHPDVIVFTSQIWTIVHFWVAVFLPVVGPTFCRSGLTILCVKVKRLSGQRFGAGAVVNIEVERIHFLRALVGNGDACVFLEWHHEE